MSESPAKFIVITPEHWGFCTLPDASVGIRVDGVATQLGLTEDLPLLVRLAPSEARQMAASLLRMADAAEAREPQPTAPIPKAPGSLQ